jgi:hypothetical protein
MQLLAGRWTGPGTPVTPGDCGCLSKKQPKLIMNDIFKVPAWLYLCITNIPSVVFFAFWLTNGQPIIPFIIFGIVDPFIFRPYMDYHRLVALGKIEEGDYREILKFGTLGYRIRYYGTLMFGN